jgi:hypothetical protein
VSLIPPFALLSNSQFRPPPPPALTSATYAADYNYTKAFGARISAVRNQEQTNIALDWRLPVTNIQTWNLIARELAEARGNTLVENARLLALLNVAINDGLDTSNTSKFYYGLWRPVTAIRHGGNGGALDTAGDPLADGNPDTVGDPAWLPLHPTTPAYPTYAGNAATVGAASATVLADFFGSNDIPFQVHWAVSGETRSYPGFWAAAQEEADSRIFGGIHFRFDSVAGQGIGRSVGGYVFTHILLPRPHPSSFGSGGASGAAAGPAPAAPTVSDSGPHATPAGADVGAAVTPGPAPARVAVAPDAVLGGPQGRSTPAFAHAAAKVARAEAADGAAGDRAGSSWADALADDLAQVRIR